LGCSGVGLDYAVGDTHLFLANYGKAIIKNEYIKAVAKLVTGRVDLCVGQNLHKHKPLITS